jgi:hypothetical protein
MHTAETCGIGHQFAAGITADAQPLLAEGHGLDKPISLPELKPGLALAGLTPEAACRLQTLGGVALAQLLPGERNGAGFRRCILWGGR